MPHVMIPSFCQVHHGITTASAVSSKIRFPHPRSWRPITKKDFFHRNWSPDHYGGDGSGWHTGAGGHARTQSLGSFLPAAKHAGQTVIINLHLALILCFSSAHSLLAAFSSIFNYSGSSSIVSRNQGLHESSVD